jgi:hypothetical protein
MVVSERDGSEDVSDGYGGLSGMAAAGGSAAAIVVRVGYCEWCGGATNGLGGCVGVGAADNYDRASPCPICWFAIGVPGNAGSIDAA